MRSLLSIVLMFFLLSAYSQDYIKMINSGNKWNYLYELYPACSDFIQQHNKSNTLKSVKCGGGETRTYSLSLSNDTMINEVTYTKVLCNVIKYNKIEVVYAGAMREDIINQKVFVRLPNQEEKLVYSFNVKVGDTISIDTTFYKDAFTIRSIKKIESYSLNGFAGKKITISDTLKRVVPSDRILPYEIHTDVWYEGIGSFKELFDLSELLGREMDLKLLCFWSNNSKIYSSDEGYCEKTDYTGVKEQPIGSIVNVYPIPSDKQLNIETNQPIKKVELKDLTGKLVISTSSLQIDISNINSGFYILVIHFRTGKMMTKKIIKNAL